MKSSIQFLIFVFLVATHSCQSQTKTSSQNVGGHCEGCEALNEYGTKSLYTVDTLPNFEVSEPKLKISGTVYENDGVTPAEDIIVYLYHTDRNGIYPTKGNEEGWAKRHGYIRGWIKTNSSGHYEFYTFRPGAYPNRNTPEHIHMTVKEPDSNPYFIDDILFDDDPLLGQNEKENRPNRGGSGIVLPKMEDGILTVRRNIILGHNIPGYN